MAMVAYGANVSNVRGKVGTNVFTKARNGPTLRIQVQPRRTRTIAQSVIRADLIRAAQIYKNMTTAQAASWTAYGQTITKHNPVNGTAYSPAGMDAFVALAAKFLQINPSGAIPLAPPGAAFPGDAITVTSGGAAGQVIFAAGGVNGASVRTELLLQPLKSRNRSPAPGNYRTKAFVAFAPGALTANVAVPAGYYAPAYRFVNTLTGQQTALVLLPTVQVT